MQVGNVHLRQNRPGAGKERPISHPPMMEEEEVAKLPARHFKRRQTMPEMMLKEELTKLRARGNGQKETYTTDRKGQPLIKDTFP